MRTPDTVGREPRRDAGLTLTELLLGMSVGSIVLLGTGVVCASALRSSTTSNVRLETMNAGRVAVDDLTRSLRTALAPGLLTGGGQAEPALVSAQASSVTFFALLNADETVGPSRVSYAVVGGVLTQSVQPPDPRPAGSSTWSWCTPGPRCVVPTRALAGGVTGPLFTYFGPQTAVLPLSATCGAAPCLAPAALGDVRAVEVRVALADPGGASTGTTYVSRVSLSNAGLLATAPAAP